MKTKITLVTVAALGLWAGALSAQPAPGDGPAQDQPEGRPGPGRPDPEMHRRMLTEKYDTNKDGKMDDAELAALGRDVLEGKLRPPAGQLPRSGGPGFGDRPRGEGGGKFDRPQPAREGGPGFQGRRPAERSPGVPGNFRPGAEGDGPRGPLAMRRDDGPERGEFRRSQHAGNAAQNRRPLEEVRKDFLKQYDANADGKLDATEREAIGRDIENGKLLPPPPPPSFPSGEPQPPRPPE